MYMTYFILRHGQADAISLAQRYEGMISGSRQAYYTGQMRLQWKSMSLW